MRSSLKSIFTRVKFTDSEESAFCVACGNATCSSKCHEEHFKAKKLCNFHANFAKDFESTGMNMRSLTLKNILYANEKRLSVGSPLNRTSRSFMFGMKHSDSDKIYTQRGFRQYGKIHVS